MGLREIVLAGLVAALPVSAQAEESETATADHLSLGLKYGYTSGIDKPFIRKEASLGINGYLVSIRFLKEEEEREEADVIEVAGLRLEGTRRHRTHQANISFGYGMYQFRRHYVNASLYGYVTGGIQLDTDYLQLPRERIPGSPEIDFLLGSGLLVEIVHPLAYWGQLPLLRNLEIGLGGTVEYLSEQVDIKEPEEGVYLGGHVVVRIGRK